jgi:hypothetical protein
MMYTPDIAIKHYSPTGATTMLKTDTCIILTETDQIGYVNGYDFDTETYDIEVDGEILTGIERSAFVLFDQPAGY